MSKIRVLHIDHARAPGGAELDLKRVLETELHWKPFLVVPSATSQQDLFQDAAQEWEQHEVLTQTETGAATTRDPVQLARFGWNILRDAARTRRVIKQNRIDIVHCNSTRSALIGTFATLGTRKVKLVLHLRDLVTKEAIGTFGYLSMRHIALPSADAVIANSRFTRETAGTQRILRKTVVVPSSIDHVVRLTRAPGDYIKFGMIARVTPWKGQLLVVEAFLEAFPETNHKLLLAGGPVLADEEYFERVSALAKAPEARGRVEMLGHVEDVQELLKKIDIGIQYSTRPEPLGQNVLQYLAAGLPAICSNEGGPTEWVTDRKNGLLVEPNSSHKLADAFRLIAQDPELYSRLKGGSSGTPIPTPESTASAWFDVFSRIARDSNATNPIKE